MQATRSQLYLRRPAEEAAKKAAEEAADGAADGSADGAAEEVYIVASQSRTSFVRKWM